MLIKQKEHDEWIVKELSENPKLQHDKEWRMNNLYWILDKDKQKSIFKMNRAQKHFFDNYLNIPVPYHRHIILKARQLGFTTFICIYILDEILFNTNREGLIISHIQKEATEIFDRKIDFALRNMCEELKNAMFRVNRNSAKKIQVIVDFGPNEGSTSSMQVSMSGRSGTFHYVHISEYAPLCIQFPKKAEEVKTGTFPAVPLDGFIFIESTAETMGDDFYVMFNEEWYRRDQITPPLSRFRFVPHFYNWTWDEMEFKKITSIIPIGEMEECPYIQWGEYQKEHGLTDLEMTYYYIKWVQLGRDVRKLNQQFPTVSEEAFIASGQTYFPTRNVLALMGKSRKGERYDLFGDKLVENPYGDLEMFKAPEKGVKYILSGDTAEGLVHGDSQVMVIINMVTEEIVALYRSNVTADEYPGLAIGLAKYYNSALIAIEANFEGRWINASIVAQGYVNVYYRQSFDDITNSMTKAYGWLTSGGRSGTRGVALTSLKVIILRKEERHFPRILLEEMQTFVMDARGKPAALSGKHDDVIMAAAIGYAVLFQMGKQVITEGQKVQDGHMAIMFGEQQTGNNFIPMQ